MKLFIRLMHVIGGCLFASGLVNYVSTARRIEGGMIRQTIFSQTPGFPKEDLLDIGKLNKENADMLNLFAVQTTIGAG
ncbi:MAG: hypothetical protein NW220_10640 [Leptolyngbyaceae cyanobacterium bins.349]|nr:hypothetical protein [Leptolyngbyaceae cyanobacterium bins.349]